MESFVKKGLSYTMDLILAITLSFSLVYAFTSTFKLAYKAQNVFIAVCIASIIYSILFINNLSLKIFAICVSFILVGMLVTFFTNPLELTLFIKNISSLTALIDKQVNGEIVLSIRYQRNIFIALNAIIPLIVYIFSVKKFNFYILLIGGTSVFVGQWIVENFRIYFSFYIFLFIILIYYLKYIYLRNIKLSKENNKVPISFLISCIPICAIVLISSYFLSSRDNPIELSWIDSKARHVSNNTKKGSNTGSNNYFKISSTGFGDDNSRLGGNVSIDNTLVMKVEAPESGIYLKGAVKEIYTGYSWESKKFGSIKLGSMLELNNFDDDLFELLQGSKIVSNETNILEEGFDKSFIDITYENLDIKTIFIPSKVSNLSFEPENSLYVVKDLYGILFSESIMQKGFKYNAELYKIDKNNEDIYNLLRRSKQGLYSEYIEHNYIGSEGNEGSRDYVISLEAKSKDIYNEYLQLPNELPKRVFDLAFEITSSVNNNYDKAKAIESYLSQNYKYTLMPGSVPEDRDFVDYFLFDSKEGYCTYYASAMTILARSIGIPTRYVEGYVLPERSTDGIYEVTNKQAHAWVEVYFEGFGWMTFEPTAPFLESLNNTTEEQILNTQNKTKKEEEIDDEVEDSKPKNNNETLKEEVSNNVNDIESKSKLFIRITIQLLVVSLLWIFIVPYFKRKIVIYRLKKYSSKQEIIKTYKRLLRGFSLQGLKINIGETPLQYAQRLDEILDSNDLSFKTITDIFNKACYSNEPISKKEIQNIIDFYNTVPIYCKKKLGKLKYFIFSNILGVI